MWQINVAVEGCGFVFVCTRYNFFYGIPVKYFRLSDFERFISSVVSIRLIAENWVFETIEIRGDCCIANGNKWCRVNKLTINFMKFATTNKTCMNLTIGYNKEII
jgi:hypothetical protein